MQMLIDMMERRLLPDALIRAGIRRLLAQRLRDEQAAMRAALPGAEAGVDDGS